MADKGARLLLHEVSVVYGTTAALDSVSLDIGAGEAVAFVGPSGAGKTTLLKLFNGAVRPTTGEVSVNGSGLSALSPSGIHAVRAGTGFVYQDLNLIPNLRVIQNVIAGRFGRRSLAGSLRDVLFPSRATIREVYGVLEQVGIAEKLYQRTDSLSGGQQQRVAIARALYQQPRALLCDEPVSSVDPSRARSVLELLKKLCGDNGLTLCVSLHNLELAREIFPRLIALREGRVLFDRRTDAISEDDFTNIYQLSSGMDPEDGAARIADHG